MRKTLTIAMLTASALFAPLVSNVVAEPAEQARALICWGDADSDEETCAFTELDCSDMGMPGGGSSQDSGGQFDCDQA